MTAPAGWYDDPEGSGQQRWWDGEGWHPVRAPTFTPPAPPPQPQAFAGSSYTTGLPAAGPGSYQAVGLIPASPWLRFGAALLEGILAIATLYIGWLVWAAMVAPKGQTPAKQLLSLRVVDAVDGRPIGFARMLFMRGIVAGWVAGIAFFFTLGILVLMPFWDRNNQNVWDKVSGTLVVNDPRNAWGL